MTLDYSQYADIDYSEPTQQYGPGPVMQWLRGAERPPLPGKFYLRERDFGRTAPDAPFVADEVFDGEGGYTASVARLLVIGTRKTVYIPTIVKYNGRDQRRKEWLPHWKPELREKGGKILTEALVLVEGVGDPVVFQVSGMNGMEFDKALRRFRAELIGPVSMKARAVIGRPLPTFAFWMPLSGLTPKGKPNVVKIEAFGSFATPPLLDLPDIDIAGVDEWAEQLAAPGGMVAFAAELAKEHEGWLKSNRYLDREARLGSQASEPPEPSAWGVDDLPPDLDVA